MFVMYKVVAKSYVWSRKIDILSLYLNIKKCVKDFVSILRSCTWSQLFYL